jgi:hypothetical protein
MSLEPEMTRTFTNAIVRGVAPDPSVCLMGNAVVRPTGRRTSTVTVSTPGCESVAGTVEASL